MIICHLWSVDPVFSAYLYCYLLMRFYNIFSLNIALLKHICTSVYLEKLKYVPGALTSFDISLLILTHFYCRFF